MSTGSKPVASAQSALTLVASLEGTVLQRLSVGVTTIGIGRLPENNLVLPDPAVSRRHAELRRVDDGSNVLVDVGSSTGTFIGDVRLLHHQPMLLEPGVEVRIGPYVLVLVRELPAPVLAPPSLTPDSLHQPAARELDEPIPVPGRETYPAPLPVDERSRYLRHLPSIYQEADFLGRMLLIFEAIWEPLEQRQEHVAMYFSPATCPAPMLAWLASWVNLDLDPHWSERRRRELVREAMQLYRWRGTRYGLTRMLEVCTGQQISVTEDPELPYVFHVTLPAYTDLSRDFIERLVRAHKPAHVAYILETAR